MFNTVHVRRRVWTISFCMFIHITAPPHPHTKIWVCSCILYNMNWNYCITCGGGDLIKCPADSKTDDGIHANAHSHNSNKLFNFEFEDTDHQPPRYIIIAQNKLVRGGSSFVLMGGFKTWQRNISLQRGVREARPGEIFDFQMPSAAI